MIAAAIEWVLIVSVRLLSGAQPRWQGCTPSPGQRIYVANHSSHLDALLLFSALPAPLRHRTRPVAAAKYWSAGPLRRYLIHSIFRGILVGGEGSSQLNPLEPVARALRQGDSLIFFPEGTRGSGEKLQPLKPGIAHLARWFPDIDIIPVWIDNSYRILPKGFAIPVPLLCSISFGAPLRWKNGQQKEEFLDQLRKELEALQPG
jgi:1-acyl-sn-glycerol-3-phosphate acyltransferase